MRDTPELWRQVGILLLSLLIPIVILKVPDWTSFNFSKSDEFILGILLFIAFLLIDIFWLANKIAAREAREEQLWTFQEACDKELLCVRACFVQIFRESYGTRDLFVTHFAKEVHQLVENVKQVAERRELRVQAEHFLNVDNVLDAFQGDSERIWRYTWPIEGTQRLFDELAWKRYFEKTVRMVDAGEIKEVRSVLVLSEPQLVQSPRVKKLLDFFHTNRGFLCFTVNRQDFRAICADNGMPANYIDFGIYGSRLLFLTEQYDPEIIGVFTKDSTRIRHYCNLFDSMWGSPSVAKKNPSKCDTKVTLEELYEFDETEPVGADQNI